VSFPCPSCGTPLVHARRRDIVYEMTGKFSTLAYLFPRVYCPRCGRDIPRNEWPDGLRVRLRNFRLKYVFFGLGLIGVILYRIYARDLAEWFRN